jgi:predicted phage terminase large subunit-like protein
MSSLRAKLAESLSYLHSRRQVIPDEDMRERSLCEGSLYEFVKRAWPYVEGGKEFTPGWHIEAIAEHLEAIYKRDIHNLVINISPRCSKSTLVSCMFPAWIWTNNPSEQFLCSSYAQILSTRDSVKCRRIISSPWYQKLWGHRVSLTGDVNTKLRFDNTRNGYRIASSVGGSNTGEGGSILLFDDPNNAKEIDSEVMRDATNDWWDQVMSTRLNDPKTGCRVVVQQRLHEKDLTGHILGKDDGNHWVHLMLPMELEIDRRCVTIPLPSTKNCVTPQKPWQDPRTYEGELMWPERMGRKELDKLKADLGSEYTIAGQLQQRPSPAGGGIIKKEWFNTWEERDPPECHYIITSFDTALTTTKTSAYSCATTWGVFNDPYEVPHVILLSMWKGRVEMPELYEMAQRLSRNYLDTNLDEPLGYEGPKPNQILVEAKANGLSLIQMLSRAGVFVTRFDPNRHGNKIARARLMTPMLEAGRVWLPAKPPHFDQLRPYADELLEACAVFPNAESNDVVDSMSQALIKIIESQAVYHPEDYRPEYLPKFNQGPLY